MGDFQTLLNCIPGRHASEVEEEAVLAVVFQRDLGGGVGAQGVRGTLPGLHAWGREGKRLDGSNSTFKARQQPKSDM